LASPFIFAPSLAIGWFARRWWHLPLGAVLLTVLDQAEIMLIEMPDAQPDWGLMPLGIIPPLCWCAAGFALRAWSRRERQRRSNQTIRALPIITGMVLGAISVAASALGVGLLYLHTDQLDSHAFGLERTTDSSAPFEVIFFQYLFPPISRSAARSANRRAHRPRPRSSARAASGTAQRQHRAVGVTSEPVYLAAADGEPLVPLRRVFVIAMTG